MNEKIEKLLVLARRARENSDCTSAGRYYEQILIEDPDNWEAAFYYDYCAAASCIIRDIGPSARCIGRAFQTAFNIIQASDVENKQVVLLTMANDALNLLAILRNSAYNHYMKHASVNGTNAEYKARVRECGGASMVIADCFYSMGDKKSAAIFYKKVSELSNLECPLSEEVVARIREDDPTFEPKKAGCYVATAVYGSYDCPQVWTLRRYRDNILAATWFGRAFIKTYYAVSPTLVKWFGQTNWFKNLWKGKLDRLVRRLQANGVESTPYLDRNW